MFMRTSTISLFLFCMMMSWANAQQCVDLLSDSNGSENTINDLAEYTKPKNNSTQEWGQLESVREFEQKLKEAGDKFMDPAKGMLERAQELDKNNLGKLLEEEGQRDGLLVGLFGALALLYSTVSDTLLYPIFSFLFFVITATLIFLLIRLIIKYRKDDFLAFRRLTFIFFLLLIVYIDLFLVIYESRRAFSLALEFQKDIILILLAALVGFIRGRLSSKRDFEEKVVP